MTAKEAKAVAAYVRCLTEPDFLRTNSGAHVLFGLDWVQDLVHKKEPGLSLDDYIWRCVDGNYLRFGKLTAVNTIIRRVLGRDDEP